MFCLQTLGQAKSVMPYRMGPNFGVVKSKQPHIHAKTVGIDIHFTTTTLSEILSSLCLPSLKCYLSQLGDICTKLCDTLIKSGNIV